jgi:hypothetical protein
LINIDSQVKDSNGPKGGTWTDTFVFQATGRGEKILTLEYIYLKETLKIKVLIFEVTEKEKNK